MEKALSDKSLTELRRSLAGTVIVPADAEYDAARRGFNALIDRHPALRFALTDPQARMIYAIGAVLVQT